MDDFTPYDYPMMGGMFGGPFHYFGLALYGILTLLCLVVVVGLVMLLARFLVVGTKAAQLYIANNGGARKAPVVNATPDAPAAPSTKPATASARAASGAADTAPANFSVTPPAARPATGTKAPITPATPTKPATKPRTPKAPPAG